MRDVPIRGEFITLGQLLQVAGIVNTGGEVKPFLMETSVVINNEHDQRRGRKIHIGDVVRVEGQEEIRLIAPLPEDSEEATIVSALPALEPDSPVVTIPHAGGSRRVLRRRPLR